MSSPAEYTFEELAVGLTAEFSVFLSEDVINRFAEFSGDYSPLHMDESYAKTTPLQGRVAHGQIGVSFFSRLIGMHLPGRYALYLNQTSSFHLPMRIGMHIEVCGTIVQKTEAAKVISIRTEIKNMEDHSLLTSGTALVKLLK